MDYFQRQTRIFGKVTELIDFCEEY